MGKGFKIDVMECATIIEAVSEAMKAKSDARDLFFLQYINIYLYMFKYPCYHKLYLICYGIDRVYGAVSYTLSCSLHFCIEYLIHVQTVKYLIHVQICFLLINYGERVYIT